MNPQASSDRPGGPSSDLGLTPGESRSIDTTSLEEEERAEARAAKLGADRRWRPWRLVSVSVLAVVLVIVMSVAGLALWFRHTLSSNLETVADPFSSISTRAPAQEVEDGRSPTTNILVLGSDSRISSGDASQWEEGAQRTDTLMVLQVSGDRDAVSVVSIPRDTWVNVPGHGHNKINAAYSYGGPSLTIQTVEELTGIYIDHFVIADFESFTALTDEVGGVTINLKTPQSLAETNFSAGPQRLNGKQALAYARERSSLPQGDLDRVKRQQTWMLAIVKQVLNNGTLSSPTKAYSFLNTAAKTVAVDEGFTMSEMQTLVWDMRGLRGGDINFMTVPTAGTSTSEDGQSIVLLDEAGSASLFAAYASDSVKEYLDKNPGAVDRLPDVVN